MKKSPAKPLVFYLGACFALFILLAFLLLLRRDFRQISPLDSTDYTEHAEDYPFHCTISSTMNADIIEITGWVGIEGEAFQQIDHTVAIYNAQDGTLFKLPTTMTIREDAMSGIAQGLNYEKGGLYAFVLPSQLSAPLSAYELCISYRTNSHNFLYHTGETLSAEVVS